MLIRFSDVERLYCMLRDQWSLHSLLAQPTTTIVLSDEHERRIRYSSWERFAALQTSSVDMTSDLTIKCELVTELPNTHTPQRCVISLTLDSGLPVVANQNKDKSSDPFFLYLLRDDWRTVEVSIDFVDFLLAKSFSGVIEEWFKSLDRALQSKWTKFFVNSSRLLTAFAGQFGRLGAAFFVLTYFFLTRGHHKSVDQIALAIAGCLVTWACVQVFAARVDAVIRQRTANALVPTALLLTDGDNRAYTKVIEGMESAGGTFLRLLGGALVAIILNVAASYLFVWLHP